MPVAFYLYVISVIVVDYFIS